MEWIHLQRNIIKGKGENDVKKRGPSLASALGRALGSCLTLLCTLLEPMDSSKVSRSAADHRQRDLRAHWQGPWHRHGLALTAIFLRLSRRSNAP